MNQQATEIRPDFSSASRGLRHVFVNRLAVQASIGIHPHERSTAQTIWLTIDAGVIEEASDTPEAIGDVVCYEEICKTVTAMACDGHIDLVETLAERIADRLMQDMRIMQIRVQIEKPEAIAEAASVGIAISRLRG
jgi:7,8-dihydroneopterin aldolase/epimerase/oxygenase